MKHTIAADFTHEALNEAFRKGKQAFLNGNAIACPYTGQIVLPLRIKWLAGYSTARNNLSIREVNHD